MSVDKYAKFISEQQKSMVNAGLAEAVDNVELDTEEFDDIVEAIINRAAKHGMSKMSGDHIKYAGFEAGHDSDS